MSEIIYSQNSEQVTAFIERCKVLTGLESEKLVALDAAWDAAWLDTRITTLEPAGFARRVTAWDAAGDAAGVTACAIVVMDLITAEQFAILTEPFAEILVELGIVWKEGDE